MSLFLIDAMTECVRSGATDSEESKTEPGKGRPRTVSLQWGSSSSAAAHIGE